MKQKSHLETISKTDNMEIWEDRESQIIFMQIDRLTIMLSPDEFDELQQLFDFDEDCNQNNQKKNILNVNFNLKDN